MTWIELDESDKAFLFFVGCLLATILIFTGILTYLEYVKMLNSEKALLICQERGFDNYKDFHYVLWSTTPKGVTCEYAPRNIFVEATR